MKMKSYESFDQWKKDQSKSNQSLIQALRKLVNGCNLPLEESVKWGNGCWLYKGLPTVYLHSSDSCVQLGFFAGAMLSDHKKRLEGKGKFIRFIPIRSKEEIDESYFLALIKKAAKIKYK
jgi:hypothetical protein